MDKGSLKVSIYIHMYMYVSAKGMCHCAYQCFREEVELFSPLIHPGLDGSHVPGACYGGDIHLQENGRNVYIHVMMVVSAEKDLTK